MERNTETCFSCRFTKEKTGGSLTCLRYPNPTRVARTQWCGEYQSDKQQVERRRRSFTDAVQPIIEEGTE